MKRTKPSRTASKVAEVVYYLSTDPQVGPLLPEGAAESTRRRLQHIGRLKPWQDRLMRKPWYRQIPMRPLGYRNRIRTIRISILCQE